MAKRRGVSLSVGRGEKSKKGGLTAKGRAKYNRATGSNLQAPVTEKNPTGKRAARRKSFCARMKGMPGPLKDKKGQTYKKSVSIKEDGGVVNDIRCTWTNPNKHCLVYFGRWDRQPFYSHEGCPRHDERLGNNESRNRRN